MDLCSVSFHNGIHKWVKTKIRLFVGDCTLYKEIRVRQMTVSFKKTWTNYMSGRIN